MEDVLQPVANTSLGYDPNVVVKINTQMMVMAVHTVLLCASIIPFAQRREAQFRPFRESQRPHPGGRILFVLL